MKETSSPGLRDLISHTPSPGVDDFTFHASAATDSRCRRTSVRLERKREEREHDPALGRLSSLAGIAAENGASEREDGEDRKTRKIDKGLPGTEVSCLEDAQKGSGET